MTIVRLLFSTKIESRNISQSISTALDMLLPCTNTCQQFQQKFVVSGCMYVAFTILRSKIRPIFSHHLCSVFINIIHERWNLSTPNDRIFGKVCNFGNFYLLSEFLSEICWQKSPKKYFVIFLFNNEIFYCMFFQKQSLVPCGYI